MRLPHAGNECHDGHMAERPAWLAEMVGRARCPRCGTPFGAEALRLIEQREERGFVWCDCRSCGGQGMVMVVLGAVTRPLPVTAPPLTTDDVLRAHDILRAHTGDIAGLFGARRGRPRGQ